jgi:hypothetical protein
LTVDETIAGQMERLLNAPQPGRFQVISAATNWSKFHQQMLHYLRNIKDFAPDLVISIDGQNDSSMHRDNSLNAWELTERFYEEQVLDSLQYRLRPLLSRSHALYLAAMLAGRARDRGVDEATLAQYEHVERPPDYERKISEFYDKNRDAIDRRSTEYINTMRYFHEILSIDRVPHLFVLQPLIHLDSTKPFTRNERAIRGYIFANIGEYLWRDMFYRSLDSRAEHLRSDLHLPFQPLLNPFSGMTATAYTDYCHLTPTGDEAFAATLIATARTSHPEIFQEAEDGSR